MGKRAFGRKKFGLTPGGAMFLLGSFPIRSCGLTPGGAMFLLGSFPIRS